MAGACCREKHDLYCRSPAGEVDFLIANNREPLLLIEAKFADEQPSKSLQIFQRSLNIPAVQLTNEGDSYRLASNDGNKILIAPAYQWLSQLP